MSNNNKENESGKPFKEDIKSMKKRYEAMQSRKDKLHSELVQKQKYYTNHLQSLKALKKLIDNHEKSSKIEVKDHLVCRYLERVHGMDIESIKNQIIPKKMIDQVKGLTHRLKIDTVAIFRSFQNF